MVNANREYIVSFIEFVFETVSKINSPSPRKMQMLAIIKMIGLRNGNFLNLLSAESPYSPKMKNTIATNIVSKYGNEEFV